MELIAFRLTTLQLAEIHNSMTKGVKHPRITRVGLVIALLAQRLSEVEPECEPIDTVSYVVNVRSFGASPATRLILSWHRGLGIYPINAVVNAVIWLSMVLQAPKGADLRDTAVAHAAEIRKSMDKLKDPKLVRDMAADVAKIQSQIAWDKNCQDMANANESCLVVNVIWG